MIKKFVLTRGQKKHSRVPFHRRLLDLVSLRADLGVGLALLARLVALVRPGVRFREHLLQVLVVLREPKLKGSIGE